MKTYRFHEVRGAVEAVMQKLRKAIETAMDERGLRTQNGFRLNLIWTKSIDTAAISSEGTLYLADRADDELVTRQILERYCGKVVHEILHAVFTDFTVNAKGQYLRQLHNALEDAFIENSAIKYGLLGNIGALMGGLADTLANEAIAGNANFNDTRQFPFMLAIAGRKHSTVQLPTPAWVQPIFDQAVADVANAANSRDTLKIAEWVLKQLQQGQKGSKGKQGQKGSKGKGEGKGPADGGQPCEDGNPDGPAGGKSEGKGEGKGAQQGQGKGEGGKGQPQAGNGSSGFSDSDGASPISADSPAADVHGKRGGEGGDKRVEGNQAFPQKAQSKDGVHVGQHRHGIDGKVSAKAKKQVRDLFEKSGLDEFSGGKKSGTLDIGKLAGVGVGKTNVFKRRLEEEGTDSAVIILVDVSDSMKEMGKIDAARAAAAELTRTLTRAGVEVAIVTFDHNHSVAHRFSTNKAKLLDAISRIRLGGSTNDYAAVRTCHAMLARHSAERKVLFVMSDGMGYRVDTKAQVAAGTRMGITTLAVGIGERVHSVYGDSAAYVEDNTKLGAAMFGKIKLAA